MRLFGAEWANMCLSAPSSFCGVCFLANKTRTCICASRTAKRRRTSARQNTKERAMQYDEATLESLLSPSMLSYVRGIKGCRLEVQWNELILCKRITTGSAARYNRGRYSGSKIHEIFVSEIVGFVTEAARLEAEQKPNTLSGQFFRRQKPVVFSSHPVCGCTQGQHAATEIVGATVTCTKCRPVVEDHTNEREANAFFAAER